jgi:serine/threonine protein kinase
MGNSSNKKSREQNLQKSMKGMKNMNLANLLKNMTVTQGNITKDYWIKIPPIGKSDIGEIREVIHKNLKRRNILKILYLNMFSDREIEMILNEIKISQKLSHPNVLEMMEYNYDNQNIYIIMEYFQGKLNQVET